LYGLLNRTWRLHDGKKYKERLAKPSLLKFWKGSAIELIDGEIVKSRSSAEQIGIFDRASGHQGLQAKKKEAKKHRKTCCHLNLLAGTTKSGRRRLPRKCNRQSAQKPHFVHENRITRNRGL